MRGQEKQAAGLYDATPLDQGGRNLLTGQVDDRVEGHDPRPGMVASRQSTEVSLLEGDGRVELLGTGDQGRREIEAGDRNTSLEEIPGDMTGSAPKVPDGPLAGEAGGKAIEQGAVERLGLEFWADPADILPGHRVVARLQGVEGVDTELRGREYRDAT